MQGRYFVHDLETDKLHIFTGGKADWLTIPEADRDVIKRACLWSNSRGCWVSRGKAGRFWTRDVLTRNGFEDHGEQGQRLTMAEQVEAKQEKAEARADRMEDRAQAADAEATARFKAERAILGCIPMGQPILVGHHSERRHRRDLARADSHMRKAIEATEKRDHYTHRAELARATADGEQYKDPRYLGNRIKEAEAEERLLLRRQSQKLNSFGEALVWTDESRARLQEALDEVQDKLGFFRHCLETCGRVVFNRESLKGKKEVLLRGGWWPIVRLNPTTVAIPNTCYPTEESQRKWALKYAYTEVKDAR